MVIELFESKDIIEDQRTPTEILNTHPNKELIADIRDYVQFIGKDILKQLRAKITGPVC